MNGFEKTGELLAILSDIGRPRLSKTDNGYWHASLEFPAPEGCTAKCASDFDHGTPDKAIQCVIDRLDGLRSMVSVQTPRAGNVAYLDASKGVR